MKKIFMILSLCVSSFNLQALTSIYNATPNPIKLKITYATSCITKNVDPNFSSDQNMSEFITMLPSNARVDISGASGQQKRIEPWCYKDILSIKATIAFHDDDKNIDTEIGRTWYRDQIDSKKISGVIRYTPQQLLILQ